METRITIAKILPVKEGTTASGKAWKRYCVQGTDKKFYARFNTPFAQGLKVGMYMLLETKPSQQEGSFDVVKVKEYGEDNADPNTPPEGKAAPSKPMNPPLPNQAPTTEQVLEKCKQLALANFPDAGHDAQCHLASVLIEYEKGRLWFNKDFRS